MDMQGNPAPLKCRRILCNAAACPCSLHQGLSLCVFSRQLRTAIGNISIYDAVKSNLPAASLVALVSLALSIGLGIASGSTPIAGLRTAIWGGVACGIFGSSPFNIIGPAGALSGMLNTYSAKWGPDILPWIAIISGGFCLLFVRLRLTRYCLFMPKSVFEGFTLSVALTIGFKQINYAFGLSGLKAHVEFLDNLWESLSHLDEAQWGSMVLFFPLTAALLLLMKHYPKVPWMVFLPLITIFFGFFFRAKDSGWNLPTLQTKFGDLPGSVALLPDPSALQKLPSSDVGSLILAGLTVAFVSVLETLISAKIAENKTTAQSLRNDLGHFDESHETHALSLGQLLSGLCGGMPCTGVFVRTNLNQANAANHTLSQFMNAILVLVVTLVAMPVFSYIPCPSIAALLVTASIRMVPTHFLHHLWKVSRFQFWLCIAIGIICTILEPVLGILGGTLVSFLVSAMKSSKNQKTCVVEDISLPTMGSDAQLRVVSLMGEVTFANAAAMVQIGTDHPNTSRTLFASDARDLSYLVASLSGTPEQNLRTLSVGVQTPQSSLCPPSVSADAPKISVCVLDLSRITLVDVDGADAIGTIGQHLARLTKKVREAAAAPDSAASQSHVYVVVGNAAPSNLYSDMWLKSKLDDGMVFRSVHGAVRDWHKSVVDAPAMAGSSDRASPLDFLNIDGNFELIAFPESNPQQYHDPPSPAVAPMRNREGSFSVDMRARLGSFHL